MTTDGKLLALRVDAHAGVGLGHATRCLALAEAWTRTDLGGTVRAVGHIDDPARSWFARAGVDVRWLDAHGDPAYERRRVAEHMEGAAVLVVDAYDADAYDAALPEDLPCPVHRVEDRDVTGANALLRRGIVDAPRLWETDRRLAPRIVVATGGADHGGLAPRMTDALAQVAARHGAEVLVVAGPWSEVDPATLPLGARVVRDLDAAAWAALLTTERPTVCVSAAGQTLWDLAYLGVPTVAVPVVANQEVNLAPFEEIGAGVVAPALRAPLAVDALLSFPAWYERCAAAGVTAMGAGDGAARLARRLWDDVTEG